MFRSIFRPNEGQTGFPSMEGCRQRSTLASHIKAARRGCINLLRQFRAGEIKLETSSSEEEEALRVHDEKRDEADRIFKEEEGAALAKREALGDLGDPAAEAANFAYNNEIAEAERRFSEAYAAADKELDEVFKTD
jgi:hypothetical protein